MKEDIFSVYPILKLIVGIISCLVGLGICLNNKFYKYDTDDMIFPATLKMFISGVLLFFVGICAFISHFFGVF